MAVCPPIQAKSFFVLARWLRAGLTAMSEFLLSIHQTYLCPNIPQRRLTYCWWPFIFYLGFRWAYLRALLWFLGTGTAHIAQPNVDSSQWIVYVVQ